MLTNANTWHDLKVVWYVSRLAFLFFWLIFFRLVFYDFNSNFVMHKLWMWIIWFWSSMFNDRNDGIQKANAQTAKFVSHNCGNITAYLRNYGRFSLRNSIYSCMTIVWLWLRSIENIPSACDISYKYCTWIYSHIHWASPWYLRAQKYVAHTLIPHFLGKCRMTACPSRIQYIRARNISLAWWNREIYLY